MSYPLAHTWMLVHSRTVSSLSVLHDVLHDVTKIRLHETETPEAYRIECIASSAYPLQWEIDPRLVSKDRRIVGGVIAGADPDKPRYFFTIALDSESTETAASTITGLVFPAASREDGVDQDPGLWEAEEEDDGR